MVKVTFDADFMHWQLHYINNLHLNVNNIYLHRLIKEYL
jgi:hypothetical protein